MIPINDLYDLIRTQKDIRFMRIFDTSNNKIMDIEGNSTEDCIKQLQDNEKKLAYFGRLYIKGANPSQKNQHFKTGSTWPVIYNNNPAQTVTGAITPAAADPFDQMAKMFTAMKMFNDMNGNNNTAGWVHPEVAKAQTELAKKTAELELEKYKLQLNNDDPIKKYGALAPMVLSALGKTPDEITKLINMSAMMHQAQNGMSKAAGTGTVLQTENVTGEFKDLQNVTEEEKNNRIEKALAELTTKISAEEMLILTESLVKNPSFATQAVLMIKNGLGTDDKKVN